MALGFNQSVYCFTIYTYRLKLIENRYCIQKIRWIHLTMLWSTIEPQFSLISENNSEVFVYTSNMFWVTKLNTYPSNFMNTKSILK